MNNKFFKFHFKNDSSKRGTSCHQNLDSFTEAMNFAYDYLDKLNDKPDTESGQYRIVGVYEILYTHDNSVPSELN